MLGVIVLNAIALSVLAPTKVSVEDSERCGCYDGVESEKVGEREKGRGRERKKEREKKKERERERKKREGEKKERGRERKKREGGRDKEK